MSRLGKNAKQSALFTLIVAAASAVILVVGSHSIFGSTSTRSTEPWRLVPPAPIEVHAGLTSVWTGKEMLISGVQAGPDGTLTGAKDVAAAYDPATNTWRRLSGPPKSDTYCLRSAVWTGAEMLVWGCGHVAFNPDTNRWRRLPAAPVGPPGLAVWTGRELIGWGGGCCGDANADGAAYSPATDTWRRLTRSPLAASQSPVGAWTGRELIVFVSGRDPDGKQIEGAARAAAYDPASDTWRRISPPPALRAIAVWDGHEVLLVGGADERGAPAATGYAYNPATNGWRRLPPMTSGRVGAVATWTGRQLLLFGGEAAANALLAYDPERNRWSSLPEAPLRERLAPAAVWTGDELIVWGGVIGTPARTPTPPEHLVDGAAFNPSSQSCCSGGQS